MPLPFPGMDPYLEDAEHWRSFHHLLADEIMGQLNAKLSTRYFADVEIRATLEEVSISTGFLAVPHAGVLEVEPWGPSQTSVATIPAAPIQGVALPLEEMKQRSVLVYVTETKTLVTAIELLSPVNKRGTGLEEYRQKRARYLRSNVHLIEIDLLRAGRRPRWELHQPEIDTDYVMLVNRARIDSDRVSEIWPVGIDQRLPTIPVPLLAADPDALLDLTAVVKHVYQRGAYARRIDYRKAIPPPAPRVAIASWLAER